MRCIDLVIECLKETIRNDDTSLDVAHFLSGQLQKNSTYATEINNVLLSINKAVARLSTLDKLETKQAVISGTGNIFDLSSLTNLKEIKAIYCIRNAQIYWLGWEYVGDNMVLLSEEPKSTTFVIYTPKPKYFVNSDICTEEGAVETSLSEYGITDEMCHYIAYFAKSELYEDRDADRCKRYLNYFEQFVAELRPSRNYPTQRAVRPQFKVR